MFDVIFTFIILVLLFLIVKLFYTSLKLFKQTDIGYKTTRALQRDYNSKMSLLYADSLSKMDLLSSNISTFQLMCLRDSRRYCAKCKDCPYGRGVK